MAEFLNPTSAKSPSPFTSDCNDGQLERAQARAAGGSAVRQNYADVSSAPHQTQPDNCLSKEQIVDLFQKCIKLASENKINEKNTWELKLIDHLSEIIKVEGEDDSRPNFQKASCTLEAGVKIYCMRVDSVHSEAYKVLGRITRAGGEDERQGNVEGVETSNDGDEGFVKKEKKISPLSTVEQSLEALNLKFNVCNCFPVYPTDPLFSRTSAPLDGGGAKGLLLNNLGVYEGCRVIFDPFEVPMKSLSCSRQNPSLEIIDLSFAREHIEQMMMDMGGKHEISPTLGEIVFLFDKDSHRCPNMSSEDPKSSGLDDASGDLWSNSILSGIFEADHSEYEEETSAGPDIFSCNDTNFPHHREGDGLRTSYMLDMDETYGSIASFLFERLGFRSTQNAWAGPDYWKYHEFKSADDVSLPESKSGVKTKRSTSKILADQDISFIKSLEESTSDIFAPPKNPRLLLLSANRVPWRSSLPEDCHYQSEDLAKLFLLPGVLCFGKEKGKSSAYNSLQADGSHHEQIPPWDNDIECCDGDASDGLVSHTRQVNKIELQYEKTSKDVHVLKKTLWDRIQGFFLVPEKVCGDAISFKHVLATFRDDCQAAPSEDISPHLCFICLLHLANEHSLTIHGFSTLDDLSIHLPTSCGKT